MLKLRKILIMSLLLVPLSIGYTQSDSDDEENPITLSLIHISEPTRLLSSADAGGGV